MPQMAFEKPPPFRQLIGESDDGEAFLNDTHLILYLLEMLKDGANRIFGVASSTRVIKLFVQFAGESVALQWRGLSQ